MRIISMSIKEITENKRKDISTKNLKGKKLPQRLEFRKDKDNLKTGDFYYETGVKTIYGIIATIPAGKSIFSKLSKE